MSASAALPDALALFQVSLDVAAMGGRLRLHVGCGAPEQDQARRDLESVARRVGRWAARLTRFEPASDLCVLNAQPDGADVPVGPTLAAVLGWAAEAGRRTQGVVDVTLLDERLAAEDGMRSALPPRAGCWTSRWTMDGRHGRVAREAYVRFDLDGVAKGWIADRALALLHRYPAAMVDADGDVAIAVGEGTDWTIDVADPDDPRGDLASLSLDRIGARVLGIATSGIHVHRWGADAGRHHLIDPATRRPASSDVAQCTVIADTAALAEALAKAVVIRGSEWGAGLLGHSDVLGTVVLRRTGEVLVSEEVLPWLA
ncbi:MAG: FAD:protein FMN transferase [Chloroflexota bacterium]